MNFLRNIFTRKEPKIEEPIFNTVWSDPESKITEHFKVKEVLYLKEWKVLHIPSEEEKQNLIKILNKMEEIRKILNTSILITSGIRPILNNPSSEYHNKDYNKFIGGSKTSYHKYGMAIDFVCEYGAGFVEKQLKPHLESLNIRMEDNAYCGRSWTHVDIGEVKLSRFFKP